MRIRSDFPDFRKTRMGMEQAMRNFPTWAGNAVLNFYKDSWRRQGYIDRTFTRWPRRANIDTGRSILIQSGTLRRSLRLRVIGTQIEISTDAPYAKAHNEGETIVQTVTPRQRRFFWAMYHKEKKMADRTSGYAGFLGGGNPYAQANIWKAMALSTTITIKVPQRQFMDKPGGDLSELMKKRLAMHLERMLLNALQ